MRLPLLLLRRLQQAVIDRELQRLCGGPRPEIVHARLQALLPAVEVHARELAHCWCLEVDVEGLGLANVRATIRREVDNLLLRDLPDGLVDRLDLRGDVGNVLDRSVMSDDEVLHVIVPETEINELAQEPWADDLELASKNTTGIDVAEVRSDNCAEI